MMRLALGISANRNLFFGSTCPVCQQVSEREAEIYISMEPIGTPNSHLPAFKSHLLPFYPRSSFQIVQRSCLIYVLATMSGKRILMLCPSSGVALISRPAAFDTTK